MKYRSLLTYLLLFVFCTSCRQSKTDAPKNNSPSPTKPLVSRYGPNAMVRNIKQSKNGNLLIAASFAGVFSYDGKSFTNLTHKLGSRRFWDVLEDRRGNIWCSTTDSGIYQYTGTSFRHFTSKEGLVNNAVGAIYEDKAGMIWFCTGAGLSRYDGQSFRNFKIKDGRWNNDITTIMEDKTGKIWIGTREEAFVYDGKTFTTLSYNGNNFNNVWSIIEDREGNIWLGGSILKAKKSNIWSVEGGLWRYNGKTFIKVSHRGASAIIEDKQGNIWTTGSVNSPNGKVWALSRYDQKSLYDKKPLVTEIMSIKGPGML